jgi:TPR repeat protein
MLRRRRQPRAAVSFSELQGLSSDELAGKLGGPAQQAALWLQASARYGLVEAQTALGQILLDGRGIAQDRTAAAGWFAIAAGAGHPPAINMLGRCCELGWGMAIDLPRAAACYRRAADAGLDWGQYNLANMLLRGRGVPRDRGQALALYQQAAGQGHAKSINMVGRFIEEGWEMPADPAAAGDWYRRAAQGGDFRAQYNLASVLAAKGEVTEAEAWLHRAMDGATPEFLALMGRRLAGTAEPRLQRLGAIAAARARSVGGSTAP